MPTVGFPLRSLELKRKGGYIQGISALNARKAPSVQREANSKQTFIKETLVVNVCLVRKPRTRSHQKRERVAFVRWEPGRGERPHDAASQRRS